VRVRCARVAVSAMAFALVAVACADDGPSERSDRSGLTATPPPTEATTTTTTGTPAAAQTGVVSGELVTPDGRTRTYRLYVPPRLPQGEVPLLVGLHGGTGWGAVFALQSGYDAFADRDGFVVVYPDGIGIGPAGDQLRTWNGGYCCGPAMNQGVDDVGFLDLLVDELSARYPIDTRRVHVVGHSNGAILAYRLACERAQRYASIGVLAASLGIDGCAPAAPIPFVHLHGLADLNHPLEGGQGPNSIAGVDFRSGVWSVEQIAAANRCTGERTAQDPGDPGVVRRTWIGCDAGADVSLVTVEGAGHMWMGGPQPGAYTDLSASRELWTFLSRYSR
jgi:polyhydroxybutyrate depolymerase